jgi:nitronate monooxygenase
VIAQGTEAGGHRGSFLDVDTTEQPGLFALLPQVASAVDVPVIAAGGIVDGRTIAAALVLGASAVQIGTAFLRCPEAHVHPRHRAALAGATDNGTRLTRLFSGKPARGLINRYMETYRDAEELVAPFPAQGTLNGPLIQAVSDDEIADLMPLWSGQSASLTREMPAAELLALLVAETEGCLKSFG